MYDLGNINALQGHLPTSYTCLPHMYLYCTWTSVSRAQKGLRGALSAVIPLAREQRVLHGWNHPAA